MLTTGKSKRRSRRLTKQEKIAVLDKVKNKLTADELDFINAAVNKRIDAARDDIFVHATATAYAVFFMVLRDKFGFERDELQTAWEYTNSYADDIATGRLKLRDLVDTLREEADIYIAMYDVDTGEEITAERKVSAENAESR